MTLLLLRHLLLTLLVGDSFSRFRPAFDYLSNFVMRASLQEKKVRFQPSPSSFIPHHTMPLPHAAQWTEHPRHVPSALHHAVQYNEELPLIRASRGRGRTRKSGRRDSSSKKRSHSRRPVEISVNVRYRGSSNKHLVLRHDVPIIIGKRHDMWDVWRLAKQQDSKLNRLHVCRKVIATDYRLKRFDVLPDKGRVKDVYKDSKHRWIFVVEKPKKKKDSCNCRKRADEEFWMM